MSDSVGKFASFMSLFAQVKELCGSEPAKLFDLAGDMANRKLCNEVFECAQVFRRAAQANPTLLIVGVDRRQTKAWRDYEEIYEPVLTRIEGWDAAQRPIAIPRGSLGDEGDRLMAIGDGALANHSLAVIRIAAEFGADSANAYFEGRASADEDILTVEEALARWDALTEELGFDLAEVARRRALIPLVLVPQEVSGRHGSSEKVSMLRNLKQAHDAFVWGAPYAALALMRSVTEAMLRDFYDAEGKNLDERIANAIGLPEGVHPAALHRLRDLANSILHVDRKRDERLKRMDDDRLDREIVSLLKVVRALVEGAK